MFVVAEVVDRTWTGRGWRWAVVPPLGKTFERFVHPEEAERVCAELEAARLWEEATRRGG